MRRRDPNRKRVGGRLGAHAPPSWSVKPAGHDTSGAASVGGIMGGTQNGYLAGLHGLQTGYMSGERAARGGRGA